MLLSSSPPQNSLWKAQKFFQMPWKAGAPHLGWGEAAAPSPPSLPPHRRNRWSGSPEEPRARAWTFP